MSSRCTPFGAFAGCSIGEYSDTSQVLFPDSVYFKKVTRIDMALLNSIISYLNKHNNINNQLTFYVNNTKYEVYDQIRYINTKYDKFNPNYHLESTHASFTLKHILKLAENGVKLLDINLYLSTFNFSKNEIEIYINNIVHNNLLFSELEPSITSLDPLKELINKLIKLPNQNEFLVSTIRTLSNLSNALDSISNASLGNAFPSYKYFHDTWRFQTN